MKGHLLGSRCAHFALLQTPLRRSGILPGFGGTQRLPRLVGLKKAVEMMLTSQVGGVCSAWQEVGREREVLQ